MKTTFLAASLFVLGSSLPMLGATMTITSNPGVDVTVHFDLGSQNSEAGLVKSTFTFEASKGVLGPTANPSSGTGLANSSKNLFAVTVSPATKAAFTHFFLTAAGAHQILVTDVNRRAAKLLPHQWRDDARSFLRVEKIQGRKVQLETIDYAHAPFQTHTFWVTVDAQGELALVP